MTKEQIREKASEFVSTRASGMPKEMDYYAEILTEFATEVTKELEEKSEKEATHRIRNFNKAIEWKEKCRTLKKENAELEIKIKHLTKHLEPQSMTALFEQVEEEIKQEQRIKELQQENENLKRGYHYEVEVINGKPTGKAILVPDNLAYAKSIIQDLLNNSDEYAKQRAREFLEENKC